MSAATVAIPFVDSRAPDWATGHGQDDHGYFAEFSIPTGPGYWQFVTQRMRWIPPGSFLMGSPTIEHERYDDETQHAVMLSRGYWLADTACPQELWMAVMRENPSQFRGDRLPVERVNFDDVAKFLQRLAELVPALNPYLPTEAQWEYACRAGTQTPFSFGSTVTTDAANFDGKHPYHGWPKGDYRRKTVDVTEFLANPWGLYQMHGNVWEWCSDWSGAYPTESQADPNGPEMGSNRIVRGGSWFNYARVVRSAYRGWRVPGSRSHDLGFRLLSSAGPVQSEPPNK